MVWLVARHQGVDIGGGAEVESPSSGAGTSAPAQTRVPRAVLAAAGAIIALIVLALVVVLAIPKGPTVYDPGSPEAAFQAFYQAYEANDVEGAYARLSSTVTEGLTLVEYRRLDADQAWQRDQDRRVVLLGSDQTGDRATLQLRIDQFSEGGLGGNRYSYQRTIRLVREGGAWLIDEPIVGIESVAYGY
jgi:hypothetical protein